MSESVFLCLLRRVFGGRGILRLVAAQGRRWLFSIALVSCSPFGFAETVSREFQLKTAYLFHFAELVEWPSSAPVSICLRGASPIRDYLQALEGQRIDGVAVHVRFDERAADCRILFLSNIDELTQRLIEQAREDHVLLVSDVDGFARHGGMVQFTLRDNKLKLVINLSEAKLAGLKLSSKLLRMAEILE